MNPNDAIDILYKRYSCRDFDGNKKISNADMNAVLEAARLAPSSLNIQPWKFIVVTNQDLKEKISVDSSNGDPMIKDCSHLLVVANLTPSALIPSSDYVQNLYPKDMGEIMIPKLELIRKNRLKADDKLINGYSREQCFIAIGQCSLAAAMIGIDSCIIGGFYSTGVKNFLKDLMPMEHLEVACLIAFGYSKLLNPKKKIRKNYDEAIKWIQ